MFAIDTQTKQEAVNFATLMNVLNCTERKLEPMFDDFGNTDIPLDSPEVCRKYAEFFDVEEQILRHAYQAAHKAFSELQQNDAIIKRGSSDYPSLLAETAQAPRFLYVRGKKSLLQEKRTVAIIGSRQASEKAKSNAKRLSGVLGKHGITVISGLAKGIDVAAHIESLRCNYNTIAVIGTSLNQYYPAENKKIQQMIERKGLVVSPFSPITQTERWHFPFRNGVMSGMSLATVIMEAGEKSGTLRQADYALKQGRQIIIPESILCDSLWAQDYIKKGAVTVKTPLDVLRILADKE